MGSARYERRSLIGQGSSGAVYEALDSERGEIVALKVLLRYAPLDVYRLKREFRALADVIHPHLVRLYELSRDDENWFYTMELIRGRTLLAYVWDADSRPSQLSPALLERAHQVLRGLSSGLQALHDHGLLHRDIKPGNILVDDEDGRVVLVDFGLVVDQGAPLNERVAGTVAYMSPEQVAGQPLTRASDWYAVGAVLYEMLAGRPPFVGPSAWVLVQKHAEDAPDIRTVAPDVPADLASLCMDLLRRDPKDRPGGAVICARLGVKLPVPPPAESVFVGRTGELEVLEKAWQARSEGLAIVHVSGTSGMGKSRLAAHFLKGLADDAVILRARCYERERTPYKAIDPLVDALASELTLWDADTVERVLPEGVRNILRVFPSFGRVNDLHPPLKTIDPQLAKTRALDSLREVIQRCADEVPVVVVIDDFQWADADSANLLVSLLRNPDPPKLLLLLLYRTNEPTLEPLLRSLTRLPSTAVEIGALPAADTDALVRQVARFDDSDFDVVRHVREAEGNPFFLVEMAHWLRRGVKPSEGSLLQRVVGDRVAALAPGARIILERVAAAGEPIDTRAALAAARIADAEVTMSDLTELVAQRMVTLRRTTLLECTHDQIRQSVVADLSPEKRQLVHKGLALALQNEADPAIVSEHFERAGELEQALTFALQAADSASERLAFDRAARMYKRCLDLHPEGDEQRLRERLGWAKAKAGHGDAGESLLRAASGIDGVHRRDLEREAAQQFLRNGDFDRAYEILPEILRREGFSWPRWKLLAFAETVWNAAVSRFGPAPAGDTSDAMRRKLEVALEMAMSLAFADLVISGLFASRAIRFADAIGEPSAQAVAAAMRAANSTLLGDVAEGEKWLEISRGLTADLHEPRARATVELQWGIVAISTGKPTEANLLCASAAEALESLGDVPYEVGMARTFQAYSLAVMGRFQAFRKLRSQVLDDARRRGDRHLECLFRSSFQAKPGLMDDQPHVTAESMDRVESIWGDRVATILIHRQTTRSQLALYEGDAERALAIADEVHRQVRGSGLLLVRINQALIHLHRMAALCRLAVDSDSAYRELETTNRKFIGMKIVGTASQGAMCEGVLHVLRGRNSEAVEAWRRAIVLLENEEQWHLCRCTELAIARVLGEGVDEAAAALTAMGIVDPARFSDLYVFVPEMET